MRSSDAPASRPCDAQISEPAKLRRPCVSSRSGGGTAEVLHAVGLLLVGAAEVDFGRGSVDGDPGAAEVRRWVAARVLEVEREEEKERP